MVGCSFNGTLAAAFAATLVEITSGLYAYGGTSIYWLLGFSFLLNVISLWKYVALIDRINTMIGKIDSLSKGTKKLPERIQAVEFDFEKLSQSFDKVTDRIYLQDGNLHDIQGQFKEEILSLKGTIKTLESQVQNGDQKIDTLVKSLETHAGQEIQDLREAMIQRFEMIEKIIGTDDLGEKTQGQDTMPPPPVRTGLPRVLATYPVIYSDKASTSKGSKGAKESRWTPVGMNDLKEIKQAVVNYGLHSTFVKEMIRTWASNVRAISHNFSVSFSGPRRWTFLDVWSLFQGRIETYGTARKNKRCGGFTGSNSWCRSLR